jgi:hypothetical protein
MIETVVALLLILNGNIIEHTFKDNLSSCLKAKTEIYMGGKKILKILE